MLLFLSMTDLTVFNNEAKKQFEISLSPDPAYVDYKWHRNKLVLLHTFVPEKARGQGIATKIAKYALDYALRNKIKVIIYCPLVAAYAKLHRKTYASIIDKIMKKKYEEDK